MQYAGNYCRRLFIFVVLAATAFTARPVGLWAQAASGGWSARGSTPSSGSGGPTARLGQGIEAFDPYAAAPSGPTPYPATPYPPTTRPPAYPSTTPRPAYPSTAPAPAYPPASSAPSLVPPSVTGPPPLAPTVPTTPATPRPAFPSAPPVLFPQSPPGQPYYGQPYPPPGQYPSSIFGPTSPFGAAPSGPYIKFFQNIRMRYTWLSGDGDRDLDINDFEFALTAAFPRFLWSTQPLLVSPGFGLHIWDGPDTAAFAPTPPAVQTAFPDLPPNAYSAYLDFAWNPELVPVPRLSGELGARIGVYTDFQTLNTDSVRIQARGLGVIQVTPPVKVKLGVIYLDRNRIKLLPAGGIFWEPNERARFDIYFPRPRASMYLTTLGNTDVWWYAAGEYGGGAWTVERGPLRGSLSDRVDINDLRISGGLEWTHMGGAKGFVEVGYVFDREVVYVRFPEDNFKPKDTIMLRAGYVY